MKTFLRLVCAAAILMTIAGLADLHSFQELTDTQPQTAPFTGPMMVLWGVITAASALLATVAGGLAAVLGRMDARARG